MPRLPIIPQVAVQNPVGQVSAPSTVQPMSQLPAQNTAMQGALNQWGQTLGDMALKRQDEDNETKVRQQAAAFTEMATGKIAEFQNLIGGNAVKAYPQLIKDLDDTIRTTETGLQNDMQRRMFQKVALESVSSFKSRAAVHYEKQRFAEDYGAREALATAREREAIEYAGGDMGAEYLQVGAEMLDKVRAAHRQVAAVASLADENARKEFMVSRMEALHDKIAQQFLQKGDPELAAKYLNYAQSVGEYTQGNMAAKVAQYEEQNTLLATQAEMTSAMEAATTTTFRADPTAKPDWTAVDKSIAAFGKANKWPAEKIALEQRQAKTSINWSVAAQHYEVGDREKALAVLQRAKAAGEFGPDVNRVELAITKDERARDAQGRAAKIETLLMEATTTFAVPMADGQQGPDQVQAINDPKQSAQKFGEAVQELRSLAKEMNWPASVTRLKEAGLRNQYHTRMATAFYEQGRFEEGLAYLEEAQMDGSYSPALGGGNGANTTAWDDDTMGAPRGYATGGVARQLQRGQAAIDKQLDSAREEQHVNQLTEQLATLPNGLARSRALIQLAVKTNLPDGVVTKVQARLNNLEADEEKARSDEGAQFLVDLQLRVAESQRNRVSYALSDQELAMATNLGVGPKALDLVTNQDKQASFTPEGHTLVLMDPETLRKTYPTRSQLYVAATGQMPPADRDRLLSAYDKGTVTEGDVTRVVGALLNIDGKLNYTTTAKGEATTTLTNESSARIDLTAAKVKEWLQGKSPTQEAVREAYEAVTKSSTVVAKEGGTFQAQTAKFVYELTPEQMKSFGVPAMEGAGVEGDIFTLAMAQSDEVAWFGVKSVGGVTVPRPVSFKEATTAVVSELVHKARLSGSDISKEDILVTALAEVQRRRAVGRAMQEGKDAVRAEAEAQRRIAAMPTMSFGGGFATMYRPSSTAQSAAAAVTDPLVAGAEEVGRRLGNIPSRLGNLADVIAGPEVVARQAQYAADAARLRAEEQDRLQVDELGRRVGSIPRAVDDAAFEFRRIIKADNRTKAEFETDRAYEELRAAAYSYANTQVSGPQRVVSDPTEELFRRFRSPAVRQPLYEPYAVWREKWINTTWSMSANSLHSLEKARTAKQSWQDAAMPLFYEGHRKDASLLGLMQGAYAHTNNGDTVPEEVTQQVMAAVADGKGRPDVARLIQAQGEQGYWTPHAVALLTKAIYTDAYLPEFSMLKPSR
jgi:hypothetical protein